MKRFVPLGTVLVVVIVILTVVSWLGGSTHTVSKAPVTVPSTDLAGNNATVTKVLDQSTLMVEYPTQLTEKVGVLGVSSSPQQCGSKATAFLSSFVNRGVVLHDEGERTDGQGRRLAYVFSGGVMLNLVMVQEGYSKVDALPSGSVYAKQFQDAEAGAKAAKKGVWGQC